MSRQRCIVAFCLGFATLLFGLTATSRAEPVGVIGLQRQPPAQDGEDLGLTSRELMRQAVLIAARDELGWLTRDASLIEPMPSGDHAAVLDIKTYVDWEKLEITLTGLADAATVVRGEPTMSGPWRGPLPVILPAAERWSRGEVVDLLRKLDLPARSRPADPADETVSVPDGVERRLRELNAIAQYQALQQLHRDIQREGESPAWLGALVRGYANLGQLCRFHFSAAEPVYSARALLYAQRLVSKYGRSRFALEHRAYAWALAGVEQKALEDLAATAELAGEPQPFVPLLDAYCRHEPRRLAAVSGEWKRLALYLRMMLAEHNGIHVQRIRWGRDLLTRQSDCFLAIDVLCDAAGVRLGHQVTLQGPVALPRSVALRLAADAATPRSVAERLPEVWRMGQPGRRMWTVQPVVEALDDADATDPAEPSWAGLGQLIAEINFAQAVRRLQFMAWSWSVPVDDAVDAMLPSVVEHRYAGVIRAHRLWDRNHRQRMAEALAEVEFADLRPAVDHIREGGWRYGNEVGRKLKSRHWSEIWRNADYTTHDLCCRAGAMRHDPRWSGIVADRLAKISPHTPRRAMARAHGDPETFAERREALEAAFGDSAVFHEAMAHFHIEQGEPEKAAPYLAKLLDEVPSEAWNEKLAEIHLSQGELEKFIAVRESWLAEEDFGLGHADARIDIARALLDHGEYRRALPYAERGAESYANWAMQVASRCNEAMGNLERAAEWTRRISRRYDNSRNDWYCFAQRTGVGDAEAALAFWKRHLPAAEEAAKSGRASDWGFIHSSRGRPEAALSAYTAAFEHHPTPYAALQAARLNGDLGLTDRRDAWLARAATMAGEDASYKVNAEATFAKLMLELLREGETLTADPVNEALDPLASGTQANLYFFAGQFAEQQGEKALARRFYREAIATGADFKFNFLLAWKRYEALGGNPYDALYPDSPAAEAYGGD